MKSKRNLPTCTSKRDPLLAFTLSIYGREKILRTPLPKTALSAIIIGVGAWRSLVSALPWGGRGREFKSRRSDHKGKPGFRDS